tara:strand:- start:469 stop:753 length:285 start_codon:yes stop_codon:yes gene_type:complete
MQLLLRLDCLVNKKAVGLHQKHLRLENRLLLMRFQGLDLELVEFLYLYYLLHLRHHKGLLHHHFLEEDLLEGYFLNHQLLYLDFHHLTHHLLQL